ncbi:amidohydrolase [Aquicoccus sp. SU-CL01552]|uniref:amidohydrolase n=1 Tax=Aquicoccus sp. SU-CL01552 TaxID=3127656 RepID=UPI0031021FEF
MTDLPLTPDIDASLLIRLQEGAQALQPWLVERRRQFHRTPELGWQEIATTAQIVRDLSADGYEVIAGPDFLGDVVRAGLSADPIPGEGETGCIALYDTGRPGPTVCLRVDIDALPIHEAGGNHAPAAGGYASEAPGVMHACGHDGHSAIGLGAARLLRPVLATGRGRLKLLFQPAEEGGRGGRAVAEAGWMDDVDLFVAIHLGLGVPSGSAAFAVHGFLANARYRVALTGQAAHAGKTPEGGRNALLGAAQAVQGLHALAQSSRPGIRVNVGLMRAGTAVNIVPDSAEFEFEMRAGDSGDLEELDRRCRAMIEGAAIAHGLEVQITRMGGAEAWSNPADIARWGAAVNARAGAFGTVLPEFFFGASEDATTLARRVDARGGSGGIFVLGADLADAHHTPHFDFDEAALSRGALLCAALIGAAMDLSEV